MIVEARSLTYDATVYPEKVGCMVMAATETTIAKVELTDWCENSALFTVASQAVHRLALLQLEAMVGRALPDEARAALEASINFGVLDCRIIKTFEGLVSIALPTLHGPTSFVVAQSQLAHQVSPG